MLNNLPTIIDGPGEYVTRDGRTVTINEVTPDPHDGCTRFSAKGAIWREFRGKVRPHGYAIWHVSGRSQPLAESRSDIVSLMSVRTGDGVRNRSV